jgi:hypothetical protein
MWPGKCHSSLAHGTGIKNRQIRYVTVWDILRLLLALLRRIKDLLRQLFSPRLRRLMLKAF